MTEKPSRFTTMAGIQIDNWENPIETRTKEASQRDLWLNLLIAIASCGALATRSENDAICVLLVAAITVLLSIKANFRNTFHMMWMIGHYAFCLMPTLLIYFSGQNFNYTAPIYCSIFSALALIITNKHNATNKYLPEQILVSARWFYAALFAILTILYISKGASYLYATPLLIVLYAAFTRQASSIQCVTGYIALSIYVLIYATFFWSEFGRLVLAGSLAAPLLALLYRLNWDWAKFPLLVATAVGGLLGSLLRIENATLKNIARSALKDSTVSPILTAQHIIETSAPNSLIRISEWWDQIVLFALGIYPRLLWNEKPLGFGFQYTLDNLTTSYINAGHSIAATFIGEHIYYLNSPLFIAGTITAIFLVALSYKALSNSQIMYGCGGYLVAIYIPTFYWGGVASFSTRFLFGLATTVFFIGTISMIRKLLRPQKTSHI